MARACEKKGVRSRKRRPLWGLNREEAVKEAQRCLGALECESCEICGLLCPDLCITRNEETGEVEIDLDYCKGCGICASVCPKGAIQMVLEQGK